MSLSSTRLGKLYYQLDAQEMNVLLKEEDFLNGEPGDYTPTEKGKRFTIKKFKDNGYGGYAARSWEWYEWDESIIDELNVTDERRKEICNKTLALRRKRLGLE